jgi:hypothetical protein
MPTEGFFDLTTPAHLLLKLEREYLRWQQDLLNTNLAWNFFVTAEHLPDWLARTAPRALRGLRIEAFKQSGQLTRICSHLANGGKHFRPTQHTSVAAMRRQEGWVKPGWVKPGWVKGSSLMVDLTPEEQETLQCPSESVEASLLAIWLLTFWQTYPALQAKPTGEPRP